MAGILGSAPTPSKPYQGPQFDLQQQLLSSMVMGNVLGQNPALLGVMGGGQNLSQQGQQAGLLKGSYDPYLANQGGVPLNGGYGTIKKTFSPNVQTGWGGSPVQSNQNSNYVAPYGPGYKSMAARPQNTPQQAGGGGGLAGSGVNTNLINSFAPQGFQQAGQSIAGQMHSNTSMGGVAPTTNSGMQYQPYQFQNPGANFTQRNPYQFSQTPQINIPDLYSPQMALAKNNIMEQSQKSQEQLLADLNRRGMLQAGGATKALTDLTLNQRDRQLADMGSQFAIQQGNMQLQEAQMRRQMEQQRQLSQAEEIFRQQGATDEQAKFLASQNVNLQNAQAGENLSGFGANLGAQQQQFGQGLSNANLLMGQQGQAFTQNLQGRQQGTAEEQLANLFRRQPLEDLFKLYGAQTGQFGGTEGSAGIWPMVVNTAAQFI